MTTRFAPGYEARIRHDVRAYDDGLLVGGRAGVVEGDGVLGEVAVGHVGS